jgi:DNA processing protein
MLEDAESEVAIAVEALRRSKRLGHAAALVLLEDLLLRHPADSTIEGVLGKAAVDLGEVSGSLSAARQEHDQGTKVGIRAIPMSSPRYPQSLRDIGDAPLILYVRGNLDALGKAGVAVVGTRKATSHGLQIAERIAEFLSVNGWPIVSGLALGIDAAAHEGALRGKSPTIAVLAHGLLKASPRANELLAQRILEAGGAWVSEHSARVPAKPEHFVLRNRIQVGLSVGSIIVEGALHSGSATQAEFCIRNKRQLFAVLPSGSPNVTIQHELPEMLVRRRGAMPIASREDYPAVLERLNKGVTADAVSSSDPR